MILRTPALPRPLAMRLAATEYERCAELLQSLEPAQWKAGTDCPAWDVRQVAAHLLGMAEMAASVRENIRQQRKAGRLARRDGSPFIDALTRLQVEERDGWTPERITGQFRARSPKAAAGRRRAPAFLRRRTMAQLNEVNGVQEPWTLGYLIDTILTRDPWMHRLDITRAAGLQPHLTADHDGVIVADVVAEWAGRHGKDFELTLTGPAGGSWRSGTGGSSLTLDAADFCRATSHRPATVTIDDLLNTEIPY
ncbi:MAG TPA: maleylpyruvate isomerase family mycothiol-dependent enzyme [Streptosporangiaceae bacterium]|nr:maleylpyruvate isomerase family mycothiol-dependent enzyme [Streptosporangiaceae bacterium]